MPIISLNRLVSAHCQHIDSAVTAIFLRSNAVLELHAIGTTWKTNDAEELPRRAGRMGEKTRGNQAETGQERGGVLGPQERRAGRNRGRLFASNDLGASAREGEDPVSLRNLLEACTPTHQGPASCGGRRPAIDATRPATSTRCRQDRCTTAATTNEVNATSSGRLQI